MAGRIREESIAEVREKAPIDEVVGAVRHPQERRRRLDEGSLPLPRREDPVVQRQPGAGRFHCFGCEEGGDVISFLMKIDGLTFTETVERLAEKYGVELQREEGDEREDRPKGPARGKLIEAHRVAQEFYAEQLLTPEAQQARQFLTERGFDAAAAETFGLGLRAARRRGRCSSTCAPRGFTRGGDRRRRAGGAEPARRVAVRPVPRAAALADPRGQRRDHRLRGPADLRRRPDRGEVPQHLRDPDLQEEPGALRHRPGPTRDGPVVAGRRGRGLHRRDGLPPGRREDRGRLVRHGVRRRARQGAAALHGRPRGVPRRGDLHLRRRRGRAEGGAEGVRRRPELRLPDLRRRRAGRARPVRRAHQEGRRRGPRAGRPAGAAVPVRARQHRVASTTSTAPTAASTRCARAPGWCRASATGRRWTRSRASSPRWSASTSRRRAPRYAAPPTVRARQASVPRGPRAGGRGRGARRRRARRCPTCATRGSPSSARRSSWSSSTRCRSGGPRPTSAPTTSPTRRTAPCGTLVEAAGGTVAGADDRGWVGRSPRARDRPGRGRRGQRARASSRSKKEPTAAYVAAARRSASWSSPRCAGSRDLKSKLQRTNPVEHPDDVQPDVRRARGARGAPAQAARPDRRDAVRLPRRTARRSRSRRGRRCWPGPRPESGVVAGTRDALYLPGRRPDPVGAGRGRRLGPRVRDASGHRGRHLGRAAAGVLASSLTEPGRLLQLVRERVTATVVLQRHVPIRGSARRPGDRPPRAHR